MDLIIQYAWIGWLAIIAIMFAVEMVSGELTFLMLGLGCTVGLGTSLVGAPIWLQIVLAVVAALVFLFLLRPPLLSWLRRRSDPKAFNVDALIGMRGVVLETVTSMSGRVQLRNGESWSARIDDDRSLAPDTPVTVATVEGATVHVHVQSAEEN